MEKWLPSHRRRINRHNTLGLLALAGCVMLMAEVPTEGKVSFLAQSTMTTSPVHWLWDPASVIGSSKLVRTDAGVSYTYHTSGLMPGHVVTVWVVVFNNPEHCATRPCTMPTDVFNPAVEADFHYAGGHVIGGSGRGNFGGHLAVGDLSGSGRAEVGSQPVPLLDPFGAEIMIALHSHGPAVPGQVLKGQLTSFLGGCQTFLGPDGLAAGPEHIPVDVGECSTFQYSVHEP